MNTELEVMWKESIMSYKHYTRQQYSLFSMAWNARKVILPGGWTNGMSLPKNG
jgi:hypothetical protein